MASRILVVEDDLDTGEMIGLLLKENHYDLQIVEDRDAALKWILKGWPDVIVLDLRTGGMPIEHLVLEVSRLCSKARIVLMSAAPGLESIAKVLGLRFFLQKPFDPDKFLSLIDDARKSGEHASV